MDVHIIAGARPPRWLCQSVLAYTILHSILECVALRGMIWHRERYRDKATQGTVRVLCGFHYEIAFDEER